MSSITLKNLPDDLHRRLRLRAARNRRSLNSEIIAALEAVVRAEPPDPRTAIERIRGLRPPGHERLTERDFDALKNEGRR